MKIHCDYTELADIGSLKPHPKNPNKHSDEQIDRLAQIIEYQGVRNPIVVSKLSGYIVAGHGRLAALKKLQAKQAPVDYQDFENADQEYAALVSDNAIAKWADLDLSAINSQAMELGPDFDIDLLGLKDFEVEPADKVEPAGEEDEVPEAPPEPKTKPGDIYVLGKHRLMCGDATSIDAVETLMDGEKADMVFTDPPYGINEKGDRSKGGTKTQGNKLDDFIDDSTEYAIEAFNVVATLDIPIQVWWGANYYAEALPPSANWLVWDKRVEENQRYRQSDCELAWAKSRFKSIRIFRHLWKGLIKASEHGQRRVHPTQKPTALAEWAFDELDGGINVLDLFGGSGSTLIACEKTGRKCFMMELEPKYCDIIVSRYLKYIGKSKVVLNGKEIDWG